MTVIGIDLGTTYSVVSYYNGTKSHIIPNKFGDLLTPSFVSKNSDGILIGKESKNNFDPKTTFFDTKRLIGKDYSEISSTCKFKIKKDNNKFQIKLQNAVSTPIEIASILLKFLKESSELNLNEEITECVITVPAYFNNAQRQDTIKAGNLAGLKVLRIINEPTSAALAYGLNKNSETETILVVDCGGGTTDISLLKKFDNSFIVKGTVGDNNLGGIDLDQIIQNYLLKETGIKNTPKNNSKIKLMAEKIKIELSEKLISKKILNSKPVILTRENFENISETFWSKINLLLNKVLKDTFTTEKEIDFVLLVGGTTRIPYFRHFLQKRFGKEKVLYKLDPDLSVAMGAGIQGYNLNTNILTLLDTIPLGLGIKTTDGLMQPVIEPNTTKPCKRTKIFSTSKDNQKTIDVSIYEGNRAEAKNNFHLSTFSMPLLEPLPRGQGNIEIIFEVDSNGILSVSAIELKTGNMKKIDINFDKVLSADTVQEMIDQGKKFQEIDSIKKKYFKLKSQIENILYSEELPIKLKEKMLYFTKIQKCNEIVLKNMEKIIDYSIKYVETQNFLKK